MHFAEHPSPNGVTATRRRHLSAHIGYLFTYLPLAERVLAAAQRGFTAVEHPQPFAVPATEMAATLREHGLSFAQIAASVGDASRGEKGLAALPGREGDFREGLARSIDYALTVGCPLIHPMAGVAPADAPSERVRDTYLANLAAAVDQAEAVGLEVLVEPISQVAVPGYYACRMDMALELVEAAAPGRVRLLLDTFHARATGLDAVQFVREHVDRLGHVHVADHPGRHEPGTGDFDFAAFLAALDEHDYAQAIGFEYIPTIDTIAGLGWLDEPAWRTRASLSSRAL